MIHLKHFIFNPIEVNTYVFYDDQKNGILIDPGCIYAYEKKELKNFIEQEKITLIRTICTHLHFDHILGADFAEKTFQIKTYAHPDDFYWLRGMKEYAGAFGMQTEEQPIEQVEWLSDGDVISEGELHLEIRHVPGHSPGGISIYAPHENLVFSGDSLFQRSIGRTDLRGGDYATLIESIQKKLMTLPDETIVYPGHGESTTIGEERCCNPYLNKPSNK